MTCGIYMIQNLVNGKIYIGQAVDIERRWVEHKKGLRGNKNKPNKHLQNAWNKYKEDNFEFTVICECDESQLNTMEEYYIFELMTYDDDIGYNKTYGGEGGRPTEETKEKLSKANKGKHHSEETKEKMSENHANYKGENHPFYGKHHSEETKEKLSKSLKGKTRSETTKRKISKAKSIPVVQIDAYTNKVVHVWGSSMAAERECGFYHGHINSCCKGKRKTHGNYKWIYLKDWLKEHNKGIPKKLYFID